MNRLDVLRKQVETLYLAGDPNADEWIDWAYENHVLFVADYAEELAKKHSANVEFVVAGALLHDVADAVMDRDNPEHEAKSLKIAEQVLHESGFDEKETNEIVYEIIEPHSCRERLPETIEGRVVATADGASHFLTEFYAYFCWKHYGPEDNFSVFKDWVNKKIEKDFTKKIFFEEVKKEILPKYEALKLVFKNT
jgi:putative nucleotidyltransferase with HDIG domain